MAMEREWVEMKKKSLCFANVEGSDSDGMQIDRT